MNASAASASSVFSYICLAPSVAGHPPPDLGAGGLGGDKNACTLALALFSRTSPDSFAQVMFTVLFRNVPFATELLTSSVIVIVPLWPAVRLDMFHKLLPVLGAGFALT